MKYTLAQNAISSLHIACKHFKNFVYDEKRKKLRESEINEEIKIALIFTENAIELLLKTIMATKEETSIYKSPNSKAILKAKQKQHAGERLEDILIKNKKIQTLGYTEIVEKIFNNRRKGAKKVRAILLELAQKRNAIMHFGIEILDYDEIISIFYNTFDVIYNYLFKELNKHPDIGKYISSDGWIVKTVHGERKLVDEDGIYNNFIDFFDEMLEELNHEVLQRRVERNIFKIHDFMDLFSRTIKDKNFKELQTKYGLTIEMIDDIIYSIYFIRNGKKEILLQSSYSVFFNASIFLDESSGIGFVVVHSTNEIYVYNSWVQYPEIDAPESDEQWKKDEQKGKCEKFVLSKRNLIQAFERVLLNNQ